MLLRFPWAKNYEQMNYFFFAMEDYTTFQELIDKLDRPLEVRSAEKVQRPLGGKV